MDQLQKIQEQITQLQKTHNKMLLLDQCINDHEHLYQLRLEFARYKVRFKFFVLIVLISVYVAIMMVKKG